MVLVALLRALQPHHGWSLWLWHGDHRWREESLQQARELVAWAASQKLMVLVDTWTRPSEEQASEASARTWRYDCLSSRARELGCHRVVTGHTATDRAETLLLNLARGCHRRGLASLPQSRSLAPGIELVRPLLGFSRADTYRLCQELQLPVWIDRTNADPSFSRNRLRQEVMPVLNDLHPGADLRLARTAEQLAAAEAASREVLELALQSLQVPAPAGGVGLALMRPALCRLECCNQGELLQLWLELQTGQRWPSRTLEALLDRLSNGSGPGRIDLGQGWQLQWQGSRLWLCQTQVPDQDEPCT